jgi:hypothetical protein
MSVEKRYADFFIFQKGGSLVALWIENNDIRHRKEWPIRRAGGSKTIYFRQQTQKNCKVSHARRIPCGRQWDERVRLYPFGICHIYDDYSDLKDVLFYKFAFQTFVYYEDVRRGRAPRLHRLLHLQSASLRTLPLGPNDEALLQKICSSPHSRSTLHLPKLSLYLNQSFWQRSIFSQDRLATELANH